MKLSKSARYALHAVLELARSKEPVTTGQVAQKFTIPEGALAAVFHQLVRAGLAQGVRGIGGGYLLAKPAAEISVLQVLEIFDPPRPAGQCLVGERECVTTPECRLRALFDEVEETARCTFASVNLETLIR